MFVLSLHIKSDEDKFYIKFVQLDEIDNFIVNDLLIWRCLDVKKVL